MASVTTAAQFQGVRHKTAAQFQGVRHNTGSCLDKTKDNPMQPKSGCSLTCLSKAQTLNAGMVNFVSKRLYSYHCSVPNKQCMLHGCVTELMDSDEAQFTQDMITKWYII
jgi:hypothetical protein